MVCVMYSDICHICRSKNWAQQALNCDNTKFRTFIYTSFVNFTLRKIPLCGHYKQKIHNAKIYPPWMTIWSSWQTSWSTKNSLMLVRWSPDSWRISPSSGSTRTLPLHLKVFFKAFAILAISKSSARPWTVVMHLRPFRCWTRMWILELSLPALLVKGSERIHKC